MKVRVTEAGAKVYDRIGFTALTVAEVPVGSDVEILTVQKRDGQKWVSVALSDGRSGYMLGETKVFANERASLLYEAYSKNSLSKRDERADSKAKIVRGAAWFIGGVMSLAAAYACAAAEGPIWLVVMLVSGAIPLLLGGGFNLVIGLLAYLGTVAD
jgi:hypothetical protein